MSDIITAIQDLAYTELLITCQVEGCQSLFKRCIEEPATDPVDAWAKTMALFACEAGWTADASGRVLCPVHKHFSEKAVPAEKPESRSGLLPPTGN